MATGNTPQHLVGQDNSITEGRPEKPSPANWHHNPAREEADPHPSNEEHPYDAPRPGGAKGAPSGAAKGRTDIGPNPAAHDGKAPPPPDNADKGPPFATS
jgi:hypothetical protein